ncbi:hypothetical protein HanPI659440_Chr00c04g0711601 [Helianthus annuus]|nr:hypothetical protein HanPI659440_Chr00c04g0711601 [Helianthus annuus]
MKELEKNLDGTKLGGSKLKVNVARFANENAKLWDSEEKAQVFDGMPAGVKCVDKGKGVNNRFRAEGISYRDMVAPKADSVPVNVERLKSIVQERVIKVHDETSAFFAFQEKAVVGRTKDVKSLPALNDLLRSSGFSKAKVYYVGGLLVLIVFPEDYEATEFISNHGLWSDWFSFLDMLEGQSLPYERIAWIKFDGVPVHLSENKVFDEMAEGYGKVVYASQLSPDVRNLSVNRVGVLVEHGNRISDTVVLSWKGKRYKVWISEEQSNWLPECLVELGRPEPAEMMDGLANNHQNPVEEGKNMNSQAQDVERPRMQVHGEGDKNINFNNDEG